MSQDNVYLNVVFNHDDNAGNSATPATYNVTRSQPVLTKCNDYYCSVIRFDIPLDQIPLFIMPTLGQANINVTPLIIGMYRLTDLVPQPENIVYIPKNPYPVPATPQQALTSPYFYVYSINHMLEMVNFALEASFQSAYPLASVLDAPQFVYDASTELISIYYTKNFIQVIDPGKQSYIFMNNELATFLDAFNFRSFGDNQPNGVDFDIAFDELPSNSYVDPVTTTEYFITTQEYNVIPMWSQLRKILITSSSLPIATEYIQINNGDPSQNVNMAVLTDFILSFNQAGESRSLAVYNPTSQYRLIDMISESPLYNIDIRIYWIDRLGNTIPLLLSVYQQASIKIAFLKKSLYKF